MVDQATVREHLARVPFLSDLDDRFAAAFARALSAREIAPDTPLFRQGDPGDSMLIVGSGRLSVRVAVGGEEKEVAAIYPGEVVGEMACVDPAPRSATVIASKKTLVFECKRKTLGEIRKKAPGLHVALVGGIVGHVTRRIRETNTRVEAEMDSRGIAHSGGGGGGAAAPPPPEDSDARIDLRALKCFEEFTADELKGLVKAAPARTYADGQVLCREGDPGRSCFIVCSGAVNVVRHMSGSDRILATLPAGTLVGQMALVDRAPRSATIKAHGKTVVLELSRKAFEKLLAAASPFALRFQHQIAVAGIRQLRTADERLATAMQAAAARASAAPPKPRPPRPDLTRMPSMQKRTAEAPSAPPSGLPRGRTPAPPEPEKKGLGARLKSAFAKIPSSVPIGGGSDETPEASNSPGEAEREEMMLAYMQAALGEWDMNMDELDGVKTVRVPGQMSAAERKSRGG